MLLFGMLAVVHALLWLHRVMLPWCAIKGADVCNCMSLWHKWCVIQCTSITVDEGLSYMAKNIDPWIKPWWNPEFIDGELNVIIENKLCSTIQTRRWTLKDGICRSEINTETVYEDREWHWVISCIKQLTNFRRTIAVLWQLQYIDWNVL